MTGWRLPSAMKQRSNEPGASTLHVTEPEVPVWRRLNFCLPEFERDPLTRFRRPGIALAFEPKRTLLP